MHAIGEFRNTRPGLISELVRSVLRVWARGSGLLERA
jgi:hypothetical protein